MHPFIVISFRIRAKQEEDDRALSAYSCKVWSSADKELGP